MRRPLDEADFETCGDEGVLLFIGREVLAGHVSEGRLVFNFGMFGHCRILFPAAGGDPGPETPGVR